MAYSTPLTGVSNAALTAAQWNQTVRDNILESAPAKATTAGRIFVATGVNAIAERVVGHDKVITSQSTSSTSFVDLATAGPATTVTTGTTAIVGLSAHMNNNTGGAACHMGVAVSGASSVAAATTDALTYESGAAADLIQCSCLIVLTGLTGGSNTFTAKYAVGAGTGTWQQRRIIVFPFG